MKKEKRNLKDLVATSYVRHTHNDSPYANLRFRFSPAKLAKFIEGLSENERAEYVAYCESPHGKRELREHEAKERRAARDRALIRKNKIFNERLSKLKLKVAQNEELRKRLEEAKHLSLNEIAEALIVFPEQLPAGHKAPALTLSRKHFKAILLEHEKEYLVYVWANTSIPLDVCYSSERTVTSKVMDNFNS